MTETTIPSRMRHLGICTHPQTPAARRACRKAAIAATQTTAIEASPTHQAGNVIDIAGTRVILIAKRTFSGRGTRWTWCTEDRGTWGELVMASPEDAIAHARRTLGTRCSCGAPATMSASTRKTCTDCYDRYAA